MPGSHAARDPGIRPSPHLRRRSCRRLREAILHAAHPVRRFPPLRRRRPAAAQSRLAAVIGFVLVVALVLVATPRTARADDPVLLSQGRTATASSSGNAGTPASAATVTNTGTRAGAEIAQLYVGDPASTGEPAKQLKGFQRVDLQPGASAKVTFTVTAHDLAYWNTAGSNWTTAAGSYQIMVGDSSRNLPLTGTLGVASATTAKTVGASATAGASVTVANPHGMSSPAGTPVRLAVTAKAAGGAAPVFTATGLPAGLSIGSDGVISGTPAQKGTSTVGVTASDGQGAADTATFVWTVT